MNRLRYRIISIISLQQYYSKKLLIRMKLGDVYEVPLGNRMKAAFQLVANDSAQLGSDRKGSGVNS